MQKLLLVTDVWGQVSGASRILKTLVPLLHERELQVTVVHPELFRRLFRFPLYPEIKFAFFPRSQMEMLFANERPDFVHIASEGSLGITARRICIEKKIPFTTCYHTNYPLYAEYYLPFGKRLSFIVSAYVRWFHSEASAVMVTTKSLQKELQALGNYPPIVIWPLGIDTDRFKRTTPPIESKEFKHPVFLYMGRIVKEKNVEEFLQLKLPGTKLVIGDGSHRAELESIYGTEATFVGYKYGNDLVEWLSVGDVCVFPSKTDTFGLAMVEALACGLPVAAHDVTGPHDVINPGVDGILDTDLQKAALSCLTLSPEACRNKALQYSWKKSADIFSQYVQTYI